MSVIIPPLAFGFPLHNVLPLILKFGIHCAAFIPCGFPEVKLPVTSLHINEYAPAPLLNDQPL